MIASCSACKTVMFYVQVLLSNNATSHMVIKALSEAHSPSRPLIIPLTI